MDDRRVFGDDRIGNVAGQQFAVANDGRERGAELVADRGEEAILALIEPLQLGNGRLLRLESGLGSQFGVLAVGDVPQVEQIPADAGILEQIHDRNLKPTPAQLDVLDSGLDGGYCPGLVGDGVEQGQYPLLILRVDEPQAWFDRAKHLLRGNAEYRLP